jgi:glycosyltransferase involved in cell wall biosynthesis
VISVARNNRVKIIFDVDDLVIEPRLIPLVVETVTAVPRDSNSEEALWNYWYAYVSRLRATMDKCDLAFVPTVPLADFISNELAFHCEVVPNFMDKAQINFSDELFEFKSSRNFRRDGKFTLGYFSGSPSHNKDFAIASTALVQFMKNHEEVELIVGGYIDTDLFSLNDLSRKVTRLPYTNHLELQKNISSVEVNLAPLQQNQFTYCKSVLKYFDAAAVGVPTIASPTPNMEQAIMMGSNGYICSDNEWLDILERLFVDFPKMGKELSINSHRDSLEKYTGLAQESEIIRLLNSL